MLQYQTYRRYFDTLFNHLLINEAGGRTLENIYGCGRLKAKLRKKKSLMQTCHLLEKVRI